jgi:hypothetical protein
MSEPESQSRKTRNWTIAGFIVFTVVFALRCWTDPRLSFPIVIGIIVWLAMAVSVSVSLWKQTRQAPAPSPNGSANSN